MEASGELLQSCNRSMPASGSGGEMMAGTIDLQVFEKQDAGS
jgi:hypothetical protein